MSDKRNLFDRVNPIFNIDEEMNALLDNIDLKLNDINCTFTALTYDKSSSIHFGEEVFAIGNLNNVGISLTKGIISNPKIMVSYNEQSREVIQCDLAIAEGNSGGALLNCHGKLIGITTFRLKDNSSNVIYGISYCIPADVVMEYIKD